MTVKRAVLLLSVLLALAAPVPALAHGGGDEPEEEPAPMVGQPMDAHAEPAAPARRSAPAAPAKPAAAADPAAPARSAPAPAAEAEDEDGHGHGSAGATAEALSLQALAILEQGMSHEEATEKLDAALAGQVAGGVDLAAVRAAHEALHAGDAAAAKAMLHDAFRGDRSHLVGLTFRPRIGTAGLVVGIAGGVALALALAGIARRRRVERRVYGTVL